MTLRTGDDAPAEAARSSLIRYTNLTYPTYTAEPAHHLIAQHLEAVQRGEIKRLMISAGPQHGKSELVSVRFPGWWMGHRPDDPIILCTYAASLAYAKSRLARMVIESPMYGRVFPGVRIGPKTKSATSWLMQDTAPQTGLWRDRRGGMLSAGVGGAITGHGARLGIIDDPIENWAAAQSVAIRRKIWDWYRTTFRPRIWEDGAIVIIMTRWHEEDLIGKILAEGSGEDREPWTVLRLSAVGEPQGDRDRRNKVWNLPAGLPDPLGREVGEALCPKRFSVKALRELKVDVGEHGWQAEYMGSPTKPEGTIFQREWFGLLQFVDAAPVEVLHRVRYWDKAGTPGGGKYTAGVMMSVTARGQYFVENVVRGQWDYGARNDIIVQAAAFDAVEHEATGFKIWLEQEPGSGGMESAQISLVQLAGHDVERETVSGDKLTRAGPFAAQCRARNVFIVRGKWNQPYVEELCAAGPGATYLDQVDASSGAFNKLVLHFQESRKKPTSAPAVVHSARQLLDR